MHIIVFNERKYSLLHTFQAERCRQTGVSKSEFGISISNKN